MRSNSSSPPQKTSSSPDAEDYPVWKRWGDLDEHSKARPKSEESGENEPSPAEALRRMAEAEKARMRESGAAEKARMRETGAAENARVRDGRISEETEIRESSVPANAPLREAAAGIPDAAHEDIDVAIEDPRSWESDFSALDIRDRVVIMLLFKQVVQIDDVEAAWRRFQSTNQGRSREPLWRILARDPAFDRDRILAEAARTAGYETAQVDPAEAARFIDAYFQSFSESDWERMLRLSVVPVGREKDPRNGRERFVFIAPDPSRPGIPKLLRDLDIDGHVIRYAPEHLIDSLLSDLTGAATTTTVAQPPQPVDDASEDKVPTESLAPRSANGAARPNSSPEPESTNSPMPRDEAHVSDSAVETAEEMPANFDDLDASRAAAEETADADLERRPTELTSRGDDSVRAAAEDDSVRAAAEDDSVRAAAEDDLVRAEAKVYEDATPQAKYEAAKPLSAGGAGDLFEECLTEAVKRGATDVHLLTVDDGVRIDMRIKGELERWRTCPMPLGDQLLSAVKESALNIMPSEIDSVQDGTIKRMLGDVTAHFRVSVLPIAGGWSDGKRESVVISMLGDGSAVKNLQSLGLPEETLGHLRDAIAEPRGMIVLAGPSGSGRSTTLSAILHETVTPKVNVITLEESVNHEIPDVRQVRLSHKLDHEDALEAVRRHDPDVILVGELRTKETAELALKLANAGHLVFSRVPAHDTTGVISRLFKLSVDPFLIAYAINLVVAQRLVRRLCPDCKQPARHVDGELLRRLGFSRQEIASTTFYDEADDKECSSCGGRRFQGHAIIAEAMPFTHETRRLIALADASFDEEDVRTQAVREGMTTIRAAARDVVIRGETSIGELIRSTAGEH